MNWFGMAVVAGMGYLLGVVPFAVIIGRACGVDVLKAGSGNPGATNVKRTCGKFAGNLCFALDALKGAAATGLPLYAPLFGVTFDGRTDYLCYAGLAAAIVGHSFSLFIGFRGGKGVATAIGGLLVIMWQVILIGLAVWALLFYATRYVSVASLGMALSLPVSAGLLFSFSGAHFYVALALAALIFVRHRSNIARLIQGRENKF